MAEYVIVKTTTASGTRWYFQDALSWTRNLAKAHHWESADMASDAALYLQPDFPTSTLTVEVVPPLTKGDKVKVRLEGRNPYVSRVVAIRGDDTLDVTRPRDRGTQTVRRTQVERI